MLYNSMYITKWNRQKSRDSKQMNDCLGIEVGWGVEEEGLKHRGIFRVANFDPVIVDVRLYKFLKTHRTYCTKVWILIFAKQKKKLED